MKPDINVATEFCVHLNALPEGKSILTSNEVDDSIYVSKPAVFGGTNRCWTPEHLFLSSVNSCFVVTLQHFCTKRKLLLSYCNCVVKGKMKFTDGYYRFCEIEISPVITIPSESDRDALLKVIEVTKNACIISHALATKIELKYNISILVGSKKKSSLMEIGGN